MNAILIALLASFAQPTPPRAGGIPAGPPVVGAYYFYWYDAGTGAHFVDPDGSDALTRHPARRAGYSWRDPEWHRGELEDMLDAGLDFVLPVYWGHPGGGEPWCDAGLSRLVEGARLRPNRSR
jgi:hypothetical protein